MTVFSASFAPLAHAQHEVQESRDRRCGAVVAVATGCFDVLHPGHLRLLREARIAAEHHANSGCGRIFPQVLLIVALNDDASVRRLKGPGRPIFTLNERAIIAGHLADVDLVTYFVGDDPSVAIRALRPDFYVKGGDYTPDTLPEGPLVEELGGQVVIVPRPEGSWSTTELLRRLRVEKRARHGLSERS